MKDWLKELAFILPNKLSQNREAPLLKKFKSKCISHCLLEQTIKPKSLGKKAVE